MLVIISPILISVSSRVISNHLCINFYWQQTASKPLYFTALVGEGRLIDVILNGNKANYFSSTTEWNEIRSEEAVCQWEFMIKTN